MDINTNHQPCVYVESCGFLRIFGIDKYTHMSINVTHRYPLPRSVGTHFFDAYFGSYQPPGHTSKGGRTMLITTGYPLAIKRGLRVIAASFFIFYAVAGCSSSKEVNYTPPEGSGGPAINHFSFSKMIVDGKEFTDVDVAIPSNGKPGVWQIGKVHVVDAADIELVISVDTRVLIIGTGANGVSEVRGDAIAKANANGVEVHVLDTAEAVKLFNKLPKVGLAAVFHTGC